MGQDFVLINDDLFPAAEATISVFDLGFMRGVGAFETLRTYAGGLPHALTAHCDRIWKAAHEFGLEPLKTEAEVRADLAKLYAHCGYDEIRVNLMVTPGQNTDGLFNAAHPTWVMIAKELKRFPAHYYSEGVKAICFDGERPLPHLKTTSYLAGRRGYLQAQAAGAHEAFYVNPHGDVTEGVTSNILIVKDQCIFEVEDDCLAGITKAGMHVLADRLGIPWSKQRISKAMLYDADECWITSAVRELIPVVQVDDQKIGSGCVGPLAKQFMSLYGQYCIDEVRADAAAT